MMERVLVISDDSEEQVWYVDPETTVEAIRILKTAGRSEDVVGQHGWRYVKAWDQAAGADAGYPRAILWANYSPDLKWLNSFRQYIESLARKADQGGLG